MIGYATKSDIAAAVGVTGAAVDYWIDTGVIPAPNRLIGKRRYYDAQTFDRIVKWALNKQKNSKMEIGEE